MIRVIYKKNQIPSVNLLYRVPEILVTLTFVRFVDMAYFPSPHTLIEVYNDFSMDIHYKDQTISWIRPVFNIPEPIIITKPKLNGDAWVYYHTAFSDKHRHNNFSVIENEIIDKEGLFADTHQVILL